MNIKPSVKINQMNFFTDHTLYSHSISNGKLRNALLEIEGLRQTIESKEKRISSLQTTNRKQERELRDIGDMNEDVAEQRLPRIGTTSLCSSGLFTPVSYEVPQKQKAGRGHQKQNSLSSSSSNSRRLFIPEPDNSKVRPFDLHNEDTPFRMSEEGQGGQLKERVRYLEKELVKKDEDLRHALQISTYLQQEIEQTFEANRILQGENEDLRQEQSDMMEMMQEAEKNERLIEQMRGQEVINLDEPTEGIQREYQKQQIAMEELKQHMNELEELKEEAQLATATVQKNFEMLKSEYSSLHKEVEQLKVANERSEKSVKFFMNENTQLKNDLVYYKGELKTIGETLREDPEEKRRVEKQLAQAMKEVRSEQRQNEELLLKLNAKEESIGVSVQIQTQDEISENISQISEEVKEMPTQDEERKVPHQPLLACYPVLVHKRKGDSTWDQVLQERSKSLKIQAQHVLEVCGRLKSLYGQLCRGGSEQAEHKQFAKLKDTLEETFKLMAELVEDILLDADTVAEVVRSEVQEGESEDGTEEGLCKRGRGKKRKKRCEDDQ